MPPLLYVNLQHGSTVAATRKQGAQRLRGLLPLLVQKMATRLKDSLEEQIRVKTQGPVEVEVPAQ